MDIKPLLKNQDKNIKSAVSEANKDAKKILKDTALQFDSLFENGNLYLAYQVCENEYNLLM